MQAGTTIELDSMESKSGVARRGEPAAARRPGQGPMPAAENESEILLDDSDSDDEFDEATTGEHRTTVPTPTPLPSSIPPSMNAHMNESTTSLVSSRSKGTVGPRKNSLFSKLLRKKSDHFGPQDSPYAENSTEASRLNRYSGNPTPVSGMRVLPDTPRSQAVRRTPGTPQSVRGGPVRGGQGKRYRITGVTPRSMQALIFYLYTSQLHFVSAPHRSPYSDATSLHEEATELLGDGSKQDPTLWPPTFSSKAAYCLGAQLDMRDLSLRAFDHLSMNMSARTVLADLLSPFGDRFGEVQRAHLEFITAHWEEIKTRPDFGPTIENLVHGQYPNSSKSLFQLFSKLSVRH